MVTEQQFEAWTAPSSESEHAKQERTIRMIREAIREHDAFSDGDCSVFAKGSYPNNTNVRLESDVDIAVQCHRAIYYYDPGKHGTHGDPYSGQWTPEFLRTAVQEALSYQFGQAAVDTSGNTAIQVHSGTGTSRVDADVVPCFDFHRYYQGWNRDGIRIFRKNKEAIENYPKQHYSTGVQKNNNTHRRYKSVVRILKNVSIRMEDEEVHRRVPSYLVESLVFNCPNPMFDETSWSARVARALAHIHSYVNSPEPSTEESRWTEADGCKFLFHVHQKWNREDAKAFVNAAWLYLFD